MSFTADINEIVEENRNGLLGKRANWKRVRLSEVASILNGAPFESGRFKKDRGTPLIRIRDIVRGRTETYYDGEYDDVYLVQHGELLVGMDGDFNCELWAGGPALLNQRVCKITTDKSRYSRQFLRYVLPGYLAAINERTPSITVKHLSSRTVADIPLPLPSIDEQREIVAKLDQQFTRLDSGMAALRRVQANLKRYRAAVLKAACEGRLVPTDAELAKAEGRTYETGEQLLTRILANRRKNWHGRGKYKEPTASDTTNLPLLPEGWVWTNIEQLRVFSLYGPRFSSSDYAEDGYVVLRTTDISDSGKVDTTNAPRLRLSADEFIKYRTKRGDLLVTRTGSLGTLAVFDDEVEAIPGAYLILFRLATEPVTTRYLFYFLKAPTAQHYLTGKGAGVGRPNLNAPTIEALPVPLPPVTEQERIVAEVERRLSVIEELEATVAANLQRATRLRQSILQRAFAG